MNDDDFATRAARDIQRLERRILNHHFREVEGKPGDLSIVTQDAPSRDVWRKSSLMLNGVPIATWIVVMSPGGDAVQVREIEPETLG